MRYTGLKGKAWEAVKHRTRDKEKDCYTCYKMDLIANCLKADAGHYKPVAIVGSNNKRAWDERFIHLQCATCNGPGQGMAYEYRTRLVQEYGEELVAEYDRLVKAKHVNPVKNWQEIIDGPIMSI